MNESSIDCFMLLREEEDRVLPVVTKGCGFAHELIVVLVPLFYLPEFSRIENRIIYLSGTTS